MKKQTTKISIGILCLWATFYTSLYASKTDLVGMQVWGVVMTVVLFLAGTMLLTFYNE